MMHPETPTAVDTGDPLFADEDEGRELLLLVESAKVVYGMNVASVQEVLRARAITRVPGTPPAMVGLVNVRGMVITVLDLDVCVKSASGTEPRHAVTPACAATETAGAGHVTGECAESERSVVLLEHGSRVAGLAVDRVRGVRPLDESDAADDTVVLLDIAALLGRHLLSTAETSR